MTSTVCLPILPLVILTTLPWPILTTLPLPTLTTLPLMMLPILPLPAVIIGSDVPSCCFLDQYQIVLIDLIQDNKPVYKFTRMAMDFNAEKMVFLDYERNATVTPITDTFLRRTVIDYSAGVRKFYSTKSSGSCTSWNDTIVPRKCLPDNATYLGQHYMGFNSSSIQAYLYQWNYKQVGFTDFITIAVQRQRMEGSSEDVCVPLFKTASVFINMTFSRPSVYTEFKPFISSDFNMTAGC